MSFLDELPQNDRENIVSLPYRVGLWLSHSDQSGGDESDEEEARALDSILQGYAQEVFGSETVQHIISETIKKKESWPEWAKSISNIPGDCKAAINALSAVVEEKEVNAYRQHLLEIGEAVALAFREYEEEGSFFQKATVYLSYMKAKRQAAKDKVAYKSFDQYLNVSMDERKALTALAHALGLTYY